MPAKKTATNSSPASTSVDLPVEVKNDNEKSGSTTRKIASHPSTAIMVREAIKELDSRKGVSSQAIQGYIKQKYPTVDLLKLKYLVRRVLKKGLETGTLVRPANATVTTGAQGKFRLAPQAKQLKPRSENADPNVQVNQKPVKEGAKKHTKTGAAKDKGSANKKTLSEDAKPPKKSKGAEATASEVAPAKKPKAKRAEGVAGKGATGPAKAKSGKEVKTKAPKAAGDSSKGKRGKSVQ
ncbi:protein B4 [Thalassophryne amazonica]|uniref:protein B4 n=1 Tax=Thalassophryne amazonica TaxID=390379 RepID=UPI00147217A8|nr:protein B4 [Thalassophryne amazonica]